LIPPDALAELANVAAVSAGFIAAIVAYIITAEGYKKFTKYFIVAIFFFVTSAILYVALTSSTFQTFLGDVGVDPTTVSNTSLLIFTLGWIYVSVVFVVASFEVEVVGLRASLRDNLEWFLESKIRGRYKESIHKENVKIQFLAKVIKTELSRGLCIFVISRLQNYMRDFAFEVLAEGFSNGEYGIYVSTNIPYHLVEDDFKNMSSDSKPRQFIIDCYSPLFGFGERPIMGKPSQFNAKDIKTLHQLIRTIRKRIGLGNDCNKLRIIYDNIDLMKFSVSETDIIRYLYHSVPIEKELGWVTVFLCNEEAKDTAIMRFVSLMADCTVTLEEKCVKNERKVFLKIANMKKTCVVDESEHEVKTMRTVPGHYISVN
jgi:KaiC/GvpD/RAD55 family RecA-like ATPase